MRNKAMRFLSLLAALTLLLTVSGCGSGRSAASSPTPQAATPTAAPSRGVSANHVFLVVFENEGYGIVVGSPSLPYFNTLANQYGLATNYFANQHSSLGDYFVLTLGEALHLNAIGDFDATVNDDNVVRELVAHSKSWKIYAESLPSVGYTGPSIYPYKKQHNPFAYLSDVVNNPAEANNLVPFSEFAGDLANDRLPNYAYIVANLQDDMHDCPLGKGGSCTIADKQSTADNWLRTNIDPLINSTGFQRDGLLIITFDEAELSDVTNGGGHIATIIVGSNVKPGYKSTTFYQHESTLRLSLEALGIPNYPGKAATAPSMSEFFQ
jgi:phosphatidylinositol-3-phosphatase